MHEHDDDLESMITSMAAELERAPDSIEEPELQAVVSRRDPMGEDPDGFILARSSSRLPLVD